MATARTSATRALAALVIPPVLISIVSLAMQTPAQATSAKPAGDGCTGAYGWPVMPFEEAHPVRANFADPRTRFDGADTPETLLEGDGTFSFHQGVDISAPDGSPVYAVASGRITRARGGRVTVHCPNGRSFQYWHINPAVRGGQRAVAGETMLGFIQSKREHVHLTQLERGRAVNPLSPGGLTPYRDETVPEVLEIVVTPDELEPGFVHLAVDAIDTAALPVPGRWNGFPVTPSRVTWRIEEEGRVVASTVVAHDVRRSAPRNAQFWETFARGTHQNWPVYARRKHQLEPGRYVFRLTADPFDTTTLDAGTYDVVVTASDTAGNRDTGRISFVVEDGAAS
jgi:hypothetical protein